MWTGVTVEAVGVEVGNLGLIVVVKPKIFC